MNPNHFQEFDGLYYVADHFDVDGNGWVTLEDLLIMLGNQDQDDKPLSDFKFFSN